MFTCFVLAANLPREESGQLEILQNTAFDHLLMIGVAQIARQTKNMRTMKTRTAFSHYRGK